MADRLRPSRAVPQDRPQNENRSASWSCREKFAWVVVGNIAASGAGVERSIAFYDDSLNPPALNVVLVRQTWQETTPNSTA